RLEAIWKKRDALKDATNTILIQDDGQGDEGPSKKRRIDVEIAYQNASIRNAKRDEFLSRPNKPLPELLRAYLAK
ncbi:3287_t:CDS:2, partial [Racocetra fulgida]